MTYAALCIAGIVVLFAIYTFGIRSNPPGFYVDESALCYNAYLVAKTGAGEFGAKFPLFFQIYSGGFTQYSNPTQIYLLAAVFWLFGPGIVIARLLAAASMFSSGLLLGLLGTRLSGRRVVGIIAGGLALITPWFFEVGRLTLETFFYPMAVMLLLWVIYRAHRKENWGWVNVVAIALTLTLVTYSYTIGRVLGPLLALGLISFAFNRKRIIALAATWVVYAVTLIPLYLFNKNNPGLTTRFYLLSYITPTSTYGEIISKFIPRFLEDLNPITMIYRGDINQRHHIPDAFGSFFLGVFVLAVIGLIVVIITKHRDAYWRFIVFGLFASVIPASLTVDAFHTLRMIAYPVFLIMLTVLALDWLLPSRQPEQEPDAESDEIVKRPRVALPWQIRHVAAIALLMFTLVEASYFHWEYYTKGASRGYVFDSAYKTLYDAAVREPERPIYLLDNYWGPAYIHAFWYATLEPRFKSEFFHVEDGRRPPPGSIVISTEQACTNCEMIRKEGTYLLYRVQ